MYKKKSICVVIPAYNEATQIKKVIETMPSYVDCIVIIDDASTDATVDVLENIRKGNSKIKVIRHKTNQGVGGAMATGYKWARDHDFDIAVRMDGDGQMDPGDMDKLLDPLAEEKADYAKGNRLITGEAYKIIPQVRYFGNAFLSFFTKIASGYWHVADSQSGYTAINKKGLASVDWDKMYTQFGQPNDLLIRLNVCNLRVADVPVKPIYNIGEKSGIKIPKVIFSISWLLFKMFFWRMKEKYIIRDFHPLIFFYLLGIFFSCVTIVLFARLFCLWGLTGHIPPLNALAAMFSFTHASIFAVFAMWFDMEANKELKP